MTPFLRGLSANLQQRRRFDPSTAPKLSTSSFNASRHRGDAEGGISGENGGMVVNPATAAYLAKRRVAAAQVDPRSAEGIAA